MDMNSLREAARERFGKACRVCRICNGVACAGEVPGMGGLGTGAAFQSNMQALALHRLQQRVVHQVNEPKLSCTIFGQKLSMPILGAPIGGIAFNLNDFLPEAEYAAAIVNGCRQAGTLGMTGDGPNPGVFNGGLEAVRLAGGQGIPVLKPRDNEAILEKMQEAADAGAVAVGMDLDAAALINMTRAGQRVGPKTKEQLAELKRHAPLPFFVKGIMTEADAEACAWAGVDGIVVSNHGGRVLDYTPGTAEVLPEIVEAVDGALTVLVDGGVRSGTDVLKMLALGADAVLIGRPLTVGAVGGADGVTFVLQQMAAELQAAMVMTGTASVEDVAEDILW